MVIGTGGTDGAVLQLSSDELDVKVKTEAADSQMYKQGKRRFHTKSRNGCDTCKRRRVKCDETKPRCLKCTHMNIECGYSTPIRKQKKKGSKKSALKESEAKESLLSAASAGFSLPGSLEHHSTSSTSPMGPGGHPGSTSTALGSTSSISITAAAASSANSIDFNKVSQNDSLAITFNPAQDNPTLSPQPSISPGSVTSPLSAHQTINSLQDLSMASGSIATIPQISIQNEHQVPHQQLHPIINRSNGLGSSSEDDNDNDDLNITDLKLLHNYSKNVAKTIITAGISESKIWSEDILELAFKYPFLMHSILGFSATYLSRTEPGYKDAISFHRDRSLKLIKEEVMKISIDNTDALVASAIILIMDSLANASSVNRGGVDAALQMQQSPMQGWVFHVKGAATILSAVWPLPKTSKFYKFITIDLGDMGSDDQMLVSIPCFDNELKDLFPIYYESPYFKTIAHLSKLHNEKYKSDFILRVISFPALLDKDFLMLLMDLDLTAMRIMRSYYSLLRGFTTEMKDKVWFLEGVSQVLPENVNNYNGGGSMHMMMDFMNFVDLPSSFLDNNFSETGF